MFESGGSMKSKEIKDLLIINLVCIIAFLVVTVFLSNSLYNQYKEEVLVNNSYVVGGLVGRYPEFESEIITSIVSRENYELGKEILEKYGLNDLESFDYKTNIKINILKINLTIIILGLFLIFGINFLFIRNKNKKLDNLNKYLNDRLNDDTIDINDYCKNDNSNLKNNIKQITDKLKEQSELLEKEKKYIEELLEDISQQIKTPLSGMYMINDVLEKEKSDKVKKDFLTRNKKQIERIEWSIASLLKLSKLDSGTIKLKQEKIKVSSLISKAIEPLKEMIINKKIAVKLNIRNTDVYVDVDWTSEAILNILKNAVEHTNGEIYIESTTDSNYTEIRISDNGNGINKEDLPFVFERFYKGNNKDSVGLGLNMSKKIMEMQNGTIKVETNDKTTFIIKLYKNI